MAKQKNIKVKTGVMGGSFNPFHLAHLNSLLTVKEQFALEELIVIPSFQTPLKGEEKMPDPSHRLKMLQQALFNYPFIQLDDQEIKRKGLSYTYKTITRLFKKSNKELFFIMGLDQFYIFDQWKNFTDILKKSNLIVTSRPGVLFPGRLTDFPKGIRPLFEKRLQKEILLKSGKKIYFCALKDMDISSSYIRKRLQEGKAVDHLIPKELNLYIKEHNLYTDDSEEIQTQALIDLCIKEMEKKKAYDISFFDLRSKPLPFSFGLIAAASNTRQTKAIAVHLKKIIKKTFGLKPIHEEGMASASWIVLDYGYMAVHIFYDYTKKVYKLEELWSS